MALVPQIPDEDSYADLSGNGGYGSANTPGSGPLLFPQNGDPYTYPTHYVASGAQATKQGLFGWILMMLAFWWKRANLVMSLGGNFTYSGAQFNLGAQGPILSATNTTPIVCQLDPAHATTAAMRNNSLVTISGGTGMTSINGTWHVQVVDSAHFVLVGSAGNGTYTASSAEASWAMSLWTFAQFLADYAALVIGNQTFGANVTVQGTLSTPNFAPGAIQPTKYYGAQIVDQTTPYTGTPPGGQVYNVGDAVGSGIDQALSPIIRFSAWGSSGNTEGMTLNMNPHTGSDNPTVTIIFDPVSLIASLLIQNNGATIFEVGKSGGGGTNYNCGSGSVVVGWKTGVGWRVVSYCGFTAAPTSGPGALTGIAW